METNIFTTMIYWLCGFSSLMAVIWFVAPFRNRYDNLFILKKKVGPRYWGRYEGAAEVPIVETIQVYPPAHEGTCTFGSRGYSSGSQGV